MAFIKIEDMTGSAEVIVFPKAYDKFGKYLFEERVIIVEGRASVSEGEAPKIVCDNIIPFDNTEEEQKPVSVGIILNEGITLQNVVPILTRRHGSIPLYINDVHNKRKYKADETYWIDVNDETISDLMSVLGDNNIVIKYR